MRDGLLAVPDGDGLQVLVTAALRGSPFDPQVQRASLAAVAAAERESAAAASGAQVLRTGAVFYAADARSRAEREAGLIGWASLGAILVLFLGVFRVRPAPAPGPGLRGGGAGGRHRRHPPGVRPDPAAHPGGGRQPGGGGGGLPAVVLHHHLGAGPKWEPRAALDRLRPALVLGLVTTLLGYAALGVAPFPGLRQMAVFSMAGLTASFLTVAWVLPGALARPMPSRPRLLAALERTLDGWRRQLRALRRWGAVLGALLILAAIQGLRPDDDVRNLIRPSRSLQAQEERIRGLTGLSNSMSFFLVEGRSEGEVLAREEALRERLGGLVAQGELDSVQAVSSFVPSPARQEAALEERLGRAPALEQAMRSVGFREDAVAALDRDLRASAGRPLTVADWLGAPFSLPFRRLWVGATVHGAASVVFPSGPCAAARLAQAAAGLEGVALVDKAGRVSVLLGRYRRLADLALGLAVLLVWAMLARWYGPRAGTRVLAPTLGGMLGALGTAALLGLPWTLFGSIALVLVLGFGVDYAVFLREAGDRPAAALLGVLLAGFATLLSL